jgi:hypothetical protein
MKIKRLIVILLLCTNGLYAQTGIGTTTPINKLDIFAVKADPATSGSTANGNLRLGATGSNNHILDFGLSSTSTYSWLQARDKTTYGTYYNLALNPNGGQVGIGTTSPSSTLTVGNADGTIGGEILLNPTTNQFEGGQIIFKRSRTGSTLDWTIDQYGTTSSNARFRIFNGGSENNGIAILENGYVGMGLANPSVKLQVNGDIIANSIGGSSDVRFKTNIRSVTNALDKIKALRGVYFNWNQNEYPDRQFGSNVELGFIAQEVEKIVPEIVTKDKTKEEYRSVKYDKLVALLVEAIKEQQKQIDSLTIKVNKLNKKNK